MTFLPIVMRELRVAARRRSTYWVRLLVALAAILIGSVILFIYQSTSPALVGGYIFKGLTVLSMIYCLVAGRLNTVDCISEEKRDGTLGLLFLTDLKGHDVVFGKLVATSLNSFYGLLAVFPVLAIPLLFGGVTNAEFWRIALVLMTTFLLSLAIAMFCSSISLDARRSAAANFALGLVLMFALPAVTGLVSYFKSAKLFVPELLYSCPVFTCVFGFDNFYKPAPHHFWCSIAIIQILTWLLLLLSCWIVPRSWQEKPIRAQTDRKGWRELWTTWSYGKAEKRPAYRKQLLDVNAFYWLAARARLKPMHVWTFLGLLGVWWLIGWWMSGSDWLDEIGNLATALILNLTLKLWIALEAGQRLAEDKKAGAFELLLPTPLTVSDILRGQWLALRRQFLWPILLVIAIELLLMRASMPLSSQGQWPVLLTWLAGIIMLVADVIALSWVAMRNALIAKSPGHATINTVTRVLILPWLAFGIVYGVALFWHLWTNWGSAPNFSPSWKFHVGWWFSLGLLADLFFGFMAWRQLLRSFRRMATHRFVQRASRAEEQTPDSDALASKPEIDRPKQRLSRKRKLLVATALVVIVGVVWVRNSTTKFPPPMIVSLSQSNAPLRVSTGPGGCFLFILPDDSLWRWGQAGGPQLGKAEIPARIGTNHNWLTAEISYNTCVGIMRDGTLWEWGYRKSGISPDPVRVGQGQDWKQVSAGNSGHVVALKRDGTLWEWGQTLAIQQNFNSVPYQTDLVQVGTDRDWMTVCCKYTWTSALALRTNGTLWAWGELGSFASGRRTVNTVPSPTQVCNETNWIGLEPGFGGLVRNRPGELWETDTSLDAQAPAAAICHLVLSNSSPDRFAFEVGGKQPKLFEVRADGTLWEQTHPFGRYLNQTPVGAWHQVGKRTDWISVWGFGPVVGLTADGTVWTWGIDPSREPVVDFSSRIELMRDRVKSIFGGSVGTTGGRQPYAKPIYQKNPRPLMRLIQSNSPPANNGQ